jgi:acylphosphatase
MGLHGYVRNLPDGSVEIVIDDQLNEFTTWLKSEFSEKYVQKIEIRKQKWEKFAEFKILY